MAHWQHGNTMDYQSHSEYRILAGKTPTMSRLRKQLIKNITRPARKHGWYKKGE